jgi:hypothetical protein
MSNRRYCKRHGSPGSSLGTLLALALLAACGGEDARPDGGEPPPDASEPPPDAGEPPLDGGAPPSSDAGEITPPPTPAPDGGPFVTLPERGSVTVTLHPGPTVSAGEPTTVAFGVPFPRSTAKSVNELRLLRGGEPVPAHFEPTARWRALSDAQDAELVDSLRSVLIYAEVTFSGADPLPLTLRYGAEPHPVALDAPPSSPRETWVGIDRGVDPDEYTSTAVEEPAVYATLPPEWLSYALLRTRTRPLDPTSSLGWFDGAFRGYSRTAVNDVSEAVDADALIDYEHEAAPWLFDRAMTLFGMYTRTGELKWLRHAHRAAQFYARHVNEHGHFDLKDWWNPEGADIKYGYGQSAFLDLMLTGDRSLLAPIERVAAAAERWDETYDGPGVESFWTERHQTYALLAALSAWEATGDERHEARLLEIVEASLAHASSPPAGLPADGCLIHAFDQHEGHGGDEPVCSPWMSALFADAMWRYYLFSEDERALVFLARLAEWAAEHGSYEITDVHPNIDGYRVPHYLVSSAGVPRTPDPWADREHACDVGGLIVRGVYAKRRLGEDASELRPVVDEYLRTCEHVLDHWHREGSDTSAGLPQWRLAPPRKYSWWFGTTQDLPWMLEAAR